MRLCASQRDTEQLAAIRVSAVVTWVTETQRWLLKATANSTWLPFELAHIAPQGAGCHESPRCNLKSQQGLNCAGLSYKNRSLTPACIAW
jgi:hypothetical protein